jgi:hypothetical protein
MILHGFIFAMVCFAMIAVVGFVGGPLSEKILRKQNGASVSDSAVSDT